MEQLAGINQAYIAADDILAETSGIGVILFSIIR